MEIIRDPSHTFADEYGVRDLILTPSEANLVRQIADRFGLPIQGTPTGRHVDLLLRHIQAIALQRASEGDRRYWGPAIAARNALGRHLGVN